MRFLVLVFLSFFCPFTAYAYHSVTINYGSNKIGNSYCIEDTPYSTSSTSNACSSDPSQIYGYIYYTAPAVGLYSRESGSGTTCPQGFYYNHTQTELFHIVDSSLCVCAAQYSWQESGSSSAIAGYECYEGACSNQFVDNALCDLDAFPLFHNGQKDDGVEDGIDCGGQSNAACISGCPDNTDLVEGGCYHTTSPDSSGNCPTGYGKEISSTTGATLSCSKRVASATVASQEWYDANPLDPYEGGASYTGGSYSEVKNTTSQTVDNGDGTSTKTTVETGTDSNGSSYTKTTNTLIDNSTGNVLGETSSTNTDTPPEDNPGNYDYGAPDGSVDGEVDSERADKFGVRVDDFFAAVGSSPIGTAFSGLSDTSSVGEGTSSFNVDLGSWGQETFDLSIYATALNTLGYFLIALSMWRSYRLIIANK